MLQSAQVTSPACGALVSARTTPLPAQNLVEPSRNPGGTLPHPRPGPPRSLSGLRPQSFQLLGKHTTKQRANGIHAPARYLTAHICPLLIASEIAVELGPTSAAGSLAGQFFGVQRPVPLDCYWVGSSDFDFFVEIKVFSTKPVDFLQRGSAATKSRAP